MIRYVFFSFDLCTAFQGVWIGGFVEMPESVRTKFFTNKAGNGAKREQKKGLIRLMWVVRL